MKNQFALDFNTQIETDTSASTLLGNLSSLMFLKAKGIPKEVMKHRAGKNTL